MASKDTAYGNRNDSMLPCPFCGSRSIDPTGVATRTGHGPDAPITYSPFCNDCSATAESVEQWNKRSAPKAERRQTPKQVATAILANSEEPLPLPSIRGLDRVLRQGVAQRWATEAFGSGQASSPPQRALRLLEEAIELAQATDVPFNIATELLSYVYARIPGDPAQELGGVALTLLLACASLGVTAEDVEIAELDRVLNKSRDYFTKRNQQKNNAGFLVPGTPVDRT